MDKKTARLVVAISALPLAAATPAAEARTLGEVMSPSSYAELLQPIPNAAALLKEAMAREASQPEPRIQTAQYYDGYGNYYPYRRRWHHHHHHHHHHHWNGGWGGGGYYGRPRYYHHHHHHHHWNGGW